jgi:hypothetical protein
VRGKPIVADLRRIHLAARDHDFANQALRAAERQHHQVPGQFAQRNDPARHEVHQWHREDEAE